MKNIEEFSGEKSQESGLLAAKMTRQKEQQEEVEEQERRQNSGIKWKPWDSRQEGNITHPQPRSFGVQRGRERKLKKLNHGHTLNHNKLANKHIQQRKKYANGTHHLKRRPKPKMAVPQSLQWHQFVSHRLCPMHTLSTVSQTSSQHTSLTVWHTLLQHSPFIDSLKRHCLSIHHS